MARYTGGIISKSGLIPTGSSASGIWSLSDYTRFIKAGTWPGQGLYAFTDATFTPGGQIGTTGPSLTQARTGLTGTGVDVWKNNTSFFNTSNGIQLWTVPRTRTYQFTIAGAKGGNATNGYTSTIAGSSGRVFTFTINLLQGQILELLIGQSGLTSVIPSGGSCGGGGGGTFIKINGGSFIAVAGGGGGAGMGNSGWPYSTPGTVGQEYNVTSGSDGVATSGSWNPAKAGGTNGGGGTNGSSNYGGACGGGITGNGVGGTQYGGYGGLSYSNGGTGGAKADWYGVSSGTGEGGFGGGAGTGNHDNYEVIGGGGGGYSGGGGGGTRVGGGGGGGSFLGSGSFVSQGLNGGNGYVTIVAL